MKLLKTFKSEDKNQSQQSLWNIQYKTLSTVYSFYYAALSCSACSSMRITILAGDFLRNLNTFNQSKYVK